MRLRTVIAGAAVLALASCSQPQPLTDAQKTALADSLAQFVAGPFNAAFEHPTVEKVMALYAPGNDVQVVDFGTIYAGRDSVTALARKWWGKPGVSARFTFGSQHVAVLSRDAAVYTAMVTAAMKDSAGVETPMRFVWTGVFVRAGGAWKLQAEHASNPPAPPPAEPAKPARPRR
jgi:ketosteroid isomerase-like protein